MDKVDWEKLKQAQRDHNNMIGFMLHCQTWDLIHLRDRKIPTYTVKSKIILSHIEYIMN